MPYKANGKAGEYSGAILTESVQSTIGNVIPGDKKRNAIQNPLIVGDHSAHYIPGAGSFSL